VKESQETLDEASTLFRFIDPFVAEQALLEQIIGLLRR